MAAFNPGWLDRRIKLLSFTSSQDPDNGEVTQAWFTLATVWAAKWQLSAKEVDRASATTATAELKFLIRYREDVTTDMRVECAGVQYVITGVAEYGRRQGLNLFARVA
ncbi:phage head closure protein [Tardibacter chloracetimidivorans]|nr:phage head closure protein [Tardibacter chloracetimidivorans]